MFKDLVVVELATVLAGPAVGMFFAEQGATVIKIENLKSGGDVTRSWRLGSEDKSKKTSAYFSSVNYNKHYKDLDLKNLSDYEKVIEIIKSADVVISNFKHKSAQKFKVDYESIKYLNPNVIYAQLDGFANSNRVAYDVVLQAETGFMFMNGQIDSPPTKMPVALIDVLAAHQLKEGILVALINKFKTGKGALVSCSLEEAALTSLVNQATNFLMNNFVPQRIGSLHPNIAPYGDIVQTKDGKSLVLAAGSQPQFQQLCEVIGAPEILNNPLFSSNKLRVEHRVKLTNALQNIFKEYNFEEIYNRLLEANVPVGQIKDLKAVFETNTAQNLILKEDIEGEKTQRLKTVAYKITTAV